MRLLLLVPEYTGWGGGIMTFYQAIAPMLVHGGVEVRIIEGSAQHAAEFAAPVVMNGIAVEHLERSRRAQWWNRFSGFAAMPGLRRHLSAAWAMWEQAGYGEGYDIVEASDWGLLFVPPAVENRCPLVVQCHGSVGQISDHDSVAGEETQDMMVRLIERDIMAQGATVQASSCANARFWTVETGLDVQMLRPARPALAAFEQQVTGRGLVIGRVQRWKGPQVVCAALRLMGARAPEIDWFGRDIAWGRREGSTAAYLAATFPDIWGTKLVHHTPIPQEEVEQRQAGALFNLIPSTWDVFNFTVVEAMASGRPTIVSTGAGASELVEDGVNGFLFPAGDAEALAVAMERVISTSPARSDEIGRAARETIRTSLDPEKITLERIAAYRKAIDDFKHNPPAPIGGWLGDICHPSERAVQDGMAFLDHHPLRAILSYSARRLGRKLWGQ